MKRGTPTHPKTFELASLLGVRHVTALGHLELLFHFTAQYCPQGDIGRYSAKRIAAALEWCGSPQKLLQSLVATGWVDCDSRVGLVVHDWSDHMDRSARQRLARQNKIPIKPDHIDTDKVWTQKNPTRNHSDSYESTPPEPVPEPEPEPVPHTHNSASTQPPPEMFVLASGNGTDRFEQLWKLFIASGVPLSDRDRKRTFRAWLGIPADQQLQVIDWVNYQMHTQWTEPRYTPQPVKALESEGWLRTAQPRTIPVVSAKQEAALEMLATDLGDSHGPETTT